MKTSQFKWAALAAGSAFVLLYGISREDGQDAANDTSQVVEPKRGGKVSEYDFSYSDGELPRRVKHVGKQACSTCAHCSGAEAVVTREQSKRNVVTWPVEVLEHFRKVNPEYAGGLEHLSRAVSFVEYEQLNEAEGLRVRRYASYTQGLLDSDLVAAVTVPHLCWGQETPNGLRVVMDKVRFLTVETARALALEEAEDSDTGEPLPVFRGTSRWSFTATDGSTGADGTPVTLTWGFVPDGTQVSGLSGEASAPSDLIARLNAVYGSSPDGNVQNAPWFEFFETAFGYWAEVTGNVYVFEPNDDRAAFPSSRGILGRRADVRIGGRNIDGNSGTLAFNFFPNTGDMVIDTADSSNFTNNSFTRRLFRNVIAHEHGHGLGMGHVCPITRTKLMEPFATGSFVGVQFDDMITAQGRYGDRYERSGSVRSNGSPATAHDLGTINSNEQLTNASISRTGDVDVYRFRVGTGKRMNLTVSPTAEAPYDEGPQTGSCNTGTSFDPRNRQNLSVRVLAPNGTTVLASADNGGLAQAESVRDVLLVSGQDYFIEVRGGGENSTAQNNAQVYSMAITVEDASTLGGSNFSIVQEGCAPANGAADPGETVTAEITVTNTGVINVPVPRVTLSGSANLEVTGNASRTLSALAPGQSTVVQFEFKLSGQCGSSETLTFAMDTGAGQTTFSESLTLGVEGIALQANFEGDGSFPANITEQSDSETARWRISTTSPIEGLRSVRTTGTGRVSSAFITSAEFVPNGNDPELSFRHFYDLENTYDGGVLEIQIGGGNWQEWTAAGGTFLENGYNQTISRFDQSHIAGQRAWSGRSNAVLRTRTRFPALALGQTCRVRWRMASDRTINSTVWRVDEISITGFECCEGNLPILSITTSDAKASEQDVSDTAELVITSSFAPSVNLDISYAVSGTATAGDDYIALSGVAVIPAGSQMVSIPVTAVTDQLAEGSENVVVELTAEANYAISDSNQASIRIEDLPFDAWRNQNFGSASVNIGDLEDFDGDGVLNLLEYALGLNPLISDTVPQILSKESDRLVLIYQEDTNLADVRYVVETSSTLGAGSWTEMGVTKESSDPIDGRRTVRASVSIDGALRFLRLRVERVRPGGGG